MTVCCESCESPWSSERCSSYLFTRETGTRLGLCKRFRSTKGASKARRDQINSEIRNMRTLLPIPQEDQDRLSYLHSMAVITAYIRKSFLYKGLSADQSCLSSSSSYPLYETFLPAVHGFILILSSQGRLVYVSENVSDYLGLSMVDVLQGDTFYDLVENQDVETVRSNLETDNTTSTERSFVCRMHTSKAFRLEYGNCCSIMVRGRYQTLPQSPQSTPTSSPDHSQSGPPVERVFLALCTPTVNHLGNSIFSSCSSSFTSLHRPDMSFSHLDESVVFYLGYSSEELIGRSWYSLLHPEDLSLSTYSHKSLMQADEGRQMEMVLRLQHSDLSWSWIYTRAAKNSGNQEVSCCNYIISETEAMYLRKKIHSDAFRASPPQPYCPSPSPQLTQSCCPTRDLKRQRAFSQSSSISETENRSKTSKRQRAESNAVFYVTSCSSSSQASPIAAFSTPPYSPTSSHYSSSSHSPTQQDDTSSDSLLDVYGYTENLTSYYHCPEGGTEVGTGPSCLLSPSRSFQPGSEQSFHQGVFSQTDAFSPQSCPSSPQYDCSACPADARLVPDCLSVSDLLESSADCPITIQDYSLSVQPQGGATSPYSLSVQPQGGATSPFSLSVQPQGGATSPYSLSVQPQGGATSPFSLSVQPQGGATSPYSLSVQPQGGATSPFSLSVQPQGGATSPYSLSVQPQGGATSPFSLSVQPQGGATSPYSLSVQPQGGATSPYSLSVQPQGGATSPYQSHHIPQTVSPPIGGLLTPNPSPTSNLSFLYSDRDKVEISILAQQISSLASSFDLFNTLSPIQTPPQPQPSSEPLPWAQLPGPSTVPLHIKPELVLDEGVFDSLLKDLSMVQGPGSLSHCYQPQDPSTLALSSLADPLPMEQSSLSLSLPLQHPSSLSLSFPLDPFHLANLDPFSLRTSCHNQTSELHQLNLPHSLHQDGLVEESMY
eukprot:XP_014037771.1 PREDICTED: neuronal PAS domain-containing protein 4-like isoform X2 [Salmo salar]